jgi:hypothetical protein
MGDDRAGLGRGDGPPRRGDIDGGEDPLSGGDGGTPRSGRRWPRVLLVLLALALGGGIGWTARDIAASTEPRPPESPAVAAPTPEPGVPCPAAADAGAAIRAQLDRAVAALRDFDPRTLQDVLDEVQRQQARLEAAVAACRAVAAPP